MYIYQYLELFYYKKYKYECLKSFRDLTISNRRAPFNAQLNYLLKLIEHTIHTKFKIYTIKINKKYLDVFFPNKLRFFFWPSMIWHLSKLP